MQHFFSSISVYDVWGWVMAALAAITVIDKGVDIIAKWRKSSPDGKQDERIAALDKRVTKLEQESENHNGFFRSDKARLDTLEEGNRVTQEALLALLSNAIDGNDKEACKKAKTDLNAFLINRK